MSEMRKTGFRIYISTLGDGPQSKTFLLWKETIDEDGNKVSNSKCEGSHDYNEIAEHPEQSQK